MKSYQNLNVVRCNYSDVSEKVLSFADIDPTLIEVNEPHSDTEIASLVLITIRSSPSRHRNRRPVSAATSCMERDRNDEEYASVSNEGENSQNADASRKGGPVARLHGHIFQPCLLQGIRPEARRVEKECGRQFRLGWSPAHH